MKFSSPIALIGLKRTYIGKLGGVHAGTRPHQLLAACFTETLKDATSKGFDATVIGDVVVGNVRNSIGNIGRVAALEAKIDESVPAMTVDRQCASSLEALAIAAGRVDSGVHEAVLVGGVESASLAPWLFEKTARAYAYFEPKPYEVLISSQATGNLPMGETAEILSDEFALNREMLDEFAVTSHQKAAAAATNGWFSKEICSIDGVTRDESVRAETTSESLSRLRPVFRRNGRLTAGNSSPLNDGAASCLVLSKTSADKLGIIPDAYLLGLDTVGLDPCRMGLGPALTIPKLLAEFGMRIEEVDLFEINEAFAAQVLAVLRHLENAGLGIPEARLNVNGGAIALGHPLGATGLRLVVTLAHALERRGEKRGIAALCAGGGQGMSALIEVP